ncbi:inorganic phosphate transporter [Candidatus Gracilibacteria bacterium]|nr:inorganic phosphate transporter [Candidatus Gracilibacteria bacterium]
MDFTYIILGICLLIVLAFEFVNGMNDTANAVAPVIYSHSLEPKKSVLIAAFLNFLGVLFGGIAVAMSIIHLLPLSTIVSQPTNFGIILVISILVSAIIWDLGAWYLALPVSSSHALIGSILGISITLMFIPVGADTIPHWGKAQEVIVGLLISPLIGFGFAFLLIYIAHIVLRRKSYFKAPKTEEDHPTFAMRSVLIGASALVSFMHGKNDGQKGVGIATLILITLLPANFAINPNMDIKGLNNDIQVIEKTLTQVNVESLSSSEKTQFIQTQSKLTELKTLTEKSDLSTGEKVTLRSNILHIQDNYKSFNTSKKITFIESAYAGGSETMSLNSIEKNINNLSQATDYVPWWIILMVSIAIGSGTMIGWKRIVKTIGEKIGKHKMNYSQAASSALITAGTIGIASSFGLPVSTTHVMSSSVAGTMVEEHGWKGGVDPHMIKHILLAWILTMPITIILAGTIFYVLQLIFLR